MNKKFGLETYVSIVIILEIIICIVLKINSILQIEWWTSLYINLFTYIIYIIYHRKRNKNGNNIIPLMVMVVSQTLLGILYIIPHFKEISILIKIWIIVLLGLVVSLIYIYIKQSITNSLEIKNIEEKYKKNIEKFEYYRDILNGYSPAILSLVYNRKIKYSDTLTATILNMKLNKYIDIEDSRNKIIK